MNYNLAYAADGTASLMFDDIGIGVDPGEGEGSLYLRHRLANGTPSGHTYVAIPGAPSFFLHDARFVALTSGALPSVLSDSQLILDHADFDGDGCPDLVFGGGKLVVLHGQGCKTQH